MVSAFQVRRKLKSIWVKTKSFSTITLILLHFNLYLCVVFSVLNFNPKQAGTELGQAQLKLKMDFTLINISYNKSYPIVNNVLNYKN